MGNNNLKETDKKKYEAMYEVEKEMNDFINNFENNREKVRDKMSTLQNSIVTTLENMCSLMGALKTIPTLDEHEKITKDLQFTQKNKDNAEDTLRLVQGQLRERQKNLEKIEQFETTLPQQLEKMKARYNEMKEEIKKFENVEEIKKNMVERRQRQTGETKELANMTRDLQQESLGVQSEMSQKKDKLRNHETYGQFTDLEIKIEQNEQLINNLKNYVMSKEEYMNGEPIMNDARNLMEQLNTIIQKENKG